jgi:hypothetical protein
MKNDTCELTVSDSYVYGHPTAKYTNSDPNPGRFQPYWEHLGTPTCTELNVSTISRTLTGN